MSSDSDRYEPVDMKRFWFCVYQEAPLFHASMNCPHLKRGVVREREDFAVAHIPVDSNEVGEPSRLNICETCGDSEPFE
jgi:hypothetical protein